MIKTLCSLKTLAIGVLALVGAEHAKWGALIRQAGLKAE